MKVSKKLTATIATALIVMFNKKLGLDMDAEQIKMLVGIVSAYLVGQGMADFSKEKAHPEMFGKTS